MTNTSNLSEINATVVTKTKETLDALSETTGMTVGEIIDRMLLTCSPEDVKKAYLLILDNVFISTQMLSPEQFNEVILMVLKALDKAFAVDEPAEIRATLNSLIEKLSKE